MCLDVLDHLQRRRLRAIRAALVASLVVHSAIVAAAALLPAPAPAAIVESITLDVVDIVAPPEQDSPEPAPSAPPPPAAPKARSAARTLAPAMPAPVEPTPAAVPSVPPEEVPSDSEAPVVAAGALVAASGAAVAGAASTAVGISGAVPGGRGTPGGFGAAGDAQRKVLFGRYRDLIRGRIGAGLRYPDEARELELAGEVVVEITVDRRGELRRARLSGPCPHTILCDDALRAVRAAAPFAPLPADLIGETQQFEVPLNYALQ
jgi:protein TonB